ncbi:hypothetical protein SKAU_G00020900 [Synaphobranchus kaupii]|uniref:Uncharacterized protein n=1 Tax=Synaphobranchus kaupii TaxID=118154 RepID=A0A9Q1JED1_SYNKA|nr:hypothetical protein SKAU_G00280970 [Synaphobranchus kaupii]KAJ8359433.1 hypothetical protein SKAU_G00159580 [Synaphobranchus kaupii]KAJ8381312.1 hypothetical protein SKAU_G00020900 [Synaphobranchus kaupii]
MTFEEPMLTSKPSIDADRSSTLTPRLASDPNSPSKTCRGPSTPVRETPGPVAATVAPASTPRKNSTPPASPGEQRLVCCS